MLNEAEYTVAFERGYQRTVNFLCIMRKVGDREFAEEIALRAWGQVWQYREAFDETKSSLETWVNMMASQTLSKVTNVLWYQAKVGGQIASISAMLIRGSEAEYVPIPLRVDQNEAAMLAKLDAEKVLAMCDRKTARRLRDYYLYDKYVPRSTLATARRKARVAIGLEAM